VSHERIRATVSTNFFETFVLKYPDKQYQTWLGGHFIKIGTDFDYDDELVNKMTAAVVSQFSDFSFSSALKILRRSDANEPRGLPRFEQAFDSVEHFFHSTSLKFLQGRRPSNLISDEQIGIVHAELFLLRLLSSFVAVRRLINWGYFSEPLTILRSNLEELAWTHAVGVKFDHKQLKNPNPSKCIGSLKLCFPAAGLLYGALSKFSHMNFDAQKHFVTDSSLGHGIMQNSIEFKFFGLLFYSFLLIAYQYVCREIRNFYAQEYSVEFDLGNIVLPLRCLVGHALLRPELDRDEIAAELALIYFEIFPQGKV
jgi:hypothetical protein